MFIVARQESLTVCSSVFMFTLWPILALLSSDQFAVFLQCRLFPADCVNTSFGEISASTHFSQSSATHLLSLEHRLHSLSTCMHSQAKSFIQCSGCYDNYECGAECYIRIWSSSCTVAHLHSFNAMVIMQAILGKQLKQRSVLKDQYPLLEFENDFYLKGQSKN